MISNRTRYSLIAVVALLGVLVVAGCDQPKPEADVAPAPAANANAQPGAVAPGTTTTTPRSMEEQHKDKAGL
ncbi:MAG: hypothetical protein H7Y38_02790 [Armatimonadetes bacterium]|nr:hypothetical protein [Armatimonadota bacterium]